MSEVATHVRGPEAGESGSRGLGTIAPLVQRGDLDDVELAAIEAEAIALFREIQQSAQSGPWDPSPVEDRHKTLRELLLVTPGVLRRFRRTFLAAGRLNFPDSPRPKEVFLEWDERLAGQKRAGAVHLARMLVALHRRQPFALHELSDTLVGSPTTFPIPTSRRQILSIVARRLFGRKRSIEGEAAYAYVTEVQARSLYYRKRLQGILGANPGAVLEIGGGYGALAAELLRNVPVPRYFLVELPETVPVAYFYLKACFACDIQVLQHAEEPIRSTARIVLLSPWLLQSVSEPVHAFVNTHSFQHMTSDNIAFYLTQAARLGARSLYLVNRDTVRDPTDVPISRYPIPVGYQVADRRRWVFGPALEVTYTRSPERAGH